jgi:hypothetical protein
MKSGQSLFSQFTDHLPHHAFCKCVAPCGGNYRLRTFSCWDHFLRLLLAQMTCRESLRDIVAELCRRRWKIEVFIKWIKQHLRIKALY